MELPIAILTGTERGCVVRLPAQHPKVMAAGNLNILRPIIMPRTRGSDVAHNAHQEKHYAYILETADKKRDRPKIYFRILLSGKTLT